MSYHYDKSDSTTSTADPSSDDELGSAGAPSSGSRAVYGSDERETSLPRPQAIIRRNVFAPPTPPQPIPRRNIFAPPTPPQPDHYFVSYTGLGNAGRLGPPQRLVRMTTPPATAMEETADQGMRIRDLEEELERVRQELKTQQLRAEQAEINVKHAKDEMKTVLEASKLDMEKIKGYRRTAEKSRDHYLEQVISYREQRDEAKIELAKCKEESNAAKEEGVTFKKERDEVKRESHDLRTQLQAAMLKIDTLNALFLDLTSRSSHSTSPIVINNNTAQHCHYASPHPLVTTSSAATISPPGPRSSPPLVTPSAPTPPSPRPPSPPSPASQIAPSSTPQPLVTTGWTRPALKPKVERPKGIKEQLLDEILRRVPPGEEQLRLRKVELESIPEESMDLRMKAKNRAEPVVEDRPMEMAVQELEVPQAAGPKDEDVKAQETSLGDVEPEEGFMEGLETSEITNLPKFDVMAEQETSSGDVELKDRIMEGHETFSGAVELKEEIMGGQETSLGNVGQVVVDDKLAGESRE